MSQLKNAKQEKSARFANRRPSEALAGIPMARLIIALTVLLAFSSGVALAEASDRAGAGPALAADTPTAGPLRIVYFHSPSCSECRRVKNFLPQITNRWGDRITLELRSVDDINVFDELFTYEKHYKATVAAPPAIFVGDRALVGDVVIIKQLDATIENALAKGIATFCPPKPEAAPSDKAVPAEQEAVPSEILSRFESFAPAAVAVAGLIDGVNPCAFTTIVFFLSMLAYLKRTRWRCWPSAPASLSACSWRTSCWALVCWAP